MSLFPSRKLSALAIFISPLKGLSGSRRGIQGLKSGALTPRLHPRRSPGNILTPWSRGAIPAEHYTLALLLAT